MKRNTKILIAVSLLVLLFFGYYAVNSLKGNKDTKNIHIKIQVDKEVIYDNEIKTEASTLGKLLETVKEFKVESENSAYGSFIVGMGVDEVYYQDETSGKYWTYSSENNKDCLKNEFCPAADTLVIENNDSFIFTLEAYE